MEKINALIEKLQELKNSGADLSTISYYAQLLQAEVLHARNKQHQQQAQSSQGNIAVIMPSQQPVQATVPAATAAQTTTLPSNKPLETPVAEPAPPAPEEVNIRAARLNDVPTHNTIIISEDINTRAARAAKIAASHTQPAASPAPQAPKPVEVPKPEELPTPVAPYYQQAPPPAAPVTPSPAAEKPAAPAAETTVAPVVSVPAPSPSEIPMAEVPPAADLVPPKPEPVVTAQPIPTLAANQSTEKPKQAQAATLFDDVPHSKENGALRKDLNELVGNNGLSLNDRLRQQQVEVAQKLGEMPINDLRQAIGINDKYQFIQELFRGDRDLYERSIKTINEFGNLQEADYWIQREIKIIQGWEDDHHLVQHFYSLLRKRFS
ncbi:hypothetical protein [Chitinophaga arvensicola]|uniref:Uncharacterized protein n=1 Tax=Chitinophaga arvensicola TaxID=29529 RepID=A0A1I0SDF2_9BACT|nr:hypothetical protein [Chitinophaga arvensicola]SEW56033.1 hypothetical protein SAMN04488122_6546 [Chitinophaga arvensicola]